MREAASWIAPSGRTTRPEASPKPSPDPGVSLVTRARDAGDAARRAEPRGIGSAGARDPLAREVKLLGALLGQVIVEQEGPELFELVEQLRRAAIRGRRAGPGGDDRRGAARPRRQAGHRAPRRRPCLHRLLPADQPRRGEASASDARASASGPAGGRHWPMGSARRSSASAATACRGMTCARWRIACA